VPYPVSSRPLCRLATKISGPFADQTFLPPNEALLIEHLTAGEVSKKESEEGRGHTTLPDCVPPGVTSPKVFPFFSRRHGGHPNASISRRALARAAALPGAHLPGVNSVERI